MEKPEKRVIDWEAMEHDWRAGIKSVLQLSKEYEVSRAAILKHWDKRGVERDLAARIHAKAQAMVAQSVVTQEVTPERRATDAAIVTANATNIAGVSLDQRRDISKTRTLAMSLIDELEHQTVNRDLYEQLGELLRKEDDKGVDKLHDLYHKVVSFGSRTTSMKQLAETLKTLIVLEREAYGIGADSGSGDDPTMGEVSDTERARRIAFALQRGLRAKQGGE